MKKYIWTVCTLILAICMLVLLRNAAKQPQAIPTGKSEILTNHQSQAEQAKVGNNQPIPKALSTTVVPAVTVASNTTTALEAAGGATSFEMAQILAAWQTPIEFYGKVVDEHSNAVSGVKVNFHWVDAPREDGNRTTNTESDAEGLFSLHGQRGPSLSVTISKEGYYAAHRGEQGFKYGPFGNPDFSPDQRNPIIFYLRKKGQGAESITSDNGFRPNLAIRVPKDSSLVRVDLFQRLANPTGQLEVSQNKPPWSEASEWSFRLSLPDGGLVEDESEFLFEAPETNYEPTVEAHFIKGTTNWTTHFVGKYYIAFGQPRRYGWLRIESDLSQETIFLTYAINPSGSRNLEPAN